MLKVPRRHTLLLITPSQLVRADCRSGYVSSCYQMACPDVDDLPLLVETAYRLGQRKNLPVVVLTTSAWTQVLTLTGKSAPILNTTEQREQLRQALAFETEPFSGISAFDSVLGFAPAVVPGEKNSYWVTQIPLYERDQVAATVTRNGTRLVGILHPSGVPTPLATTATTGVWERIEQWPDLYYCLRGVKSRLQSQQIIHASGTAATQAIHEWQTSVDVRALEPIAHREELLSEAPLLDDDEPDNTSAGNGKTSRSAVVRLDLTDAVALRNWLAVWSNALITGFAVPFLPAPARETSPAAKGVLSWGLATAAFFGCWGHARWVDQEEKRLDAEATKLAEPGQQLAQLKKQAEPVQKDLQERTDEVAWLRQQLAASQQLLEQQRQRIPRLVQEVSRLSADDWVIQTILEQADGVTITGVALQPEAVSRLANQLQSGLTDCGWQVQPASQTAENMLSNGGPWQFKIELLDRQPPALPPAPSHLAGGRRSRR